MLSNYILTNYLEFHRVCLGKWPIRCDQRCDIPHSKVTIAYDTKTPTGVGGQGPPTLTISAAKQ